MKVYKYFLIILFVFFIEQSLFSQSDIEAVSKIIQTQQTCWNNGDIPCFMEYYWKNDSLTFVGKSGIQYGWENTLKNYIKTYPNQLAMGQLNFEIIKMEQLSKDAIYVLGKWNLIRKDDHPKGNFTLIFKKINGSWLIVSDHSS